MIEQTYVPDAEKNRGKQIVDLIVPEAWAGASMQRIGQYEAMLNDREINLFGSNRIYRVFPFGTVINMQHDAGDVKAVIPCEYCGSMGARGCACRSCGAPIR